MVLRGNSIATKATEIYLRLVGETYLPIILSDFVHAVSGGTRKASDQIEQVPVKTAKHLRHTATVVPSEVSNVDCEVDTARVQNSALLASNQANLLRLVQMVWEKIIASEPHFPKLVLVVL
ncbi:unnamed protein product [Dicrocoelium dendriticum]|nr:unnamed protein product [Dicrocoelium dendriticum]